MPKLVRETTPLAEKATSSAGGRMRVHAITAGLGSSGYYSPDVLREAADNQLIVKGTPLFLDHASESETHDRPERSVKDIAAVFTDEATYDEAEEALVGEIQVFTPYRELLSEMAPHIGLSISGSATDIVEGEHDGKQVRMIEGLAAIDSVDFVTRAGRGGKVVELLESARANRRAVEHGISEATVNDRREALQAALNDAYGSDGQSATYVWVRDFDDTTVWFELERAGEDSGLYAQAYAEGDNAAITLTGERTEVRAVTTYVPATSGAPSTTDSSESDHNVPAARPDGNTTTESQEELMGKIQIEEAEHSSLVEKAGRVEALETENASLKAENTTLKEADAKRTREDTARHIVTAKATEAGVEFTSLEVAGLLAGMPVKDGALDEAAFTTTVETHVKEKTDAGGFGQIRGFGSTGGGQGGGHITEADFDKTFERKGA